MLAGLFLSLPMSSGPSAARLQDVPAAQVPLVVRAQRVILRPGEELADASILIERGVIVAIGQELVVPEGARVLEGAVACAGFVDPWSSLGLDPLSAQDPGATPATRALDAYDPWFVPETRREALRAGVTALCLQHGKNAALAGIGALMHTDEGSEPAVVLADACLAGSIGLTRGGRAPDVFDRVGEVDRLIGGLEKGRRLRESQVEYKRELENWLKAIGEKTAELEKDFKKAKKDREKEQKDAEEKAKEFKEKKYKEDKKPRKPRADPDDASLARAVEGEIPLVIEVHRASEIRRLLEKTAAYSRLRLVIAGGTEALPFAEELVERAIPVIVWPAPLGLARADEYEAHDPALAGDLARAGVRVLIGSGGGADARELRFLASLAVGHGMEREAALAAITSAPAQVFDAAAQLGSLARGRSGDVLVLDGDPLDSTATLRFVVSRGEVVVQ